jgi:hypothetical protein
MVRQIRMHAQQWVDGAWSAVVELALGWHVEGYDTDEFRDLLDHVNMDPRHRMCMRGEPWRWKLENPARTYDVPLGAWVVRFAPWDSSSYFVVFADDNQMAAFEEDTEDFGWLPIRTPDRQARLEEMEHARVHRHDQGHREPHGGGNLRQW